LPGFLQYYKKNMDQAKLKQNKKRSLIGQVVSNKMAKTVVVSIERVVMHPLYRKRRHVNKRLKADTGSKTYQVGDRVSIEECRPLSHDKRWRVTGKARA